MLGQTTDRCIASISFTTQLTHTYTTCRIPWKSNALECISISFLKIFFIYYWMFLTKGYQDPPSLSKRNRLTRKNSQGQSAQHVEREDLMKDWTLNLPLGKFQGLAMQWLRQSHESKFLKKGAGLRMPTRIFDTLSMARKITTMYDLYMMYMLEVKMKLILIY